MSDIQNSEGESSSHDALRFHYLKSALYRIIHVDGAYGGISPRGLVQLNLYSERPPIPRETVHKILPDGSTEELREERVVRDGAIRELEVGALMDITAAKALHEWLGDKIATLEKLMRERNRE